MAKQNTPSYAIKITNWHSERNKLQAIREEVFIKEQHVPIELEWDEFDKSATHLLAQHIQKEKILAIGTARIVFYNKGKDNIAHIGRMAVLKTWRHIGVGSKLLQTCICECKKHHSKKIMLNAQTSAIPFYQKAGFTISSEEFLDAKIPHKEMTLQLTD
jgi:predicted GNAT family N-acyltransferase